MQFNILDIVPGTTVDGPGLRTAIYMAGCNHGCPGCHNPESWDFNAGRRLTLSEIMATVIDNGFPVTLTGGDPLCTPAATECIIDSVREADLGDIWLYTGFTFEEILADERLCRLASKVDVIVEGPFDEHLRDISLRFRGSDNQRILLAPQSLSAGSPVMWQPPVFDI